jgi:transposase
MQIALTLRLAFGLRLRQTEGFLTSVLQLMGLDLAVPDHTTLSRPARTWRSAGRRERPKISTKEAIDSLVHSTGLEVYGAGQWLEEKHGAKSRRGWRKLYLALDADKGDIIAHVMTGRDMGDNAQVGPLLDQIDGPIGKFMADGAYDGDPTYDAISRHSADAAVIILPRANAIDRLDTGIDSQRDRHIAAINTDGRMKWQTATGYGSGPWSRPRSAATSRSSDTGCEHARSARNRPKLPAAAPSSTECWHVHARSPSGPCQQRHSHNIKESIH